MQVVNMWRMVYLYNYMPESLMSFDTVIQCLDQKTPQNLKSKQR